MLQVKQKRKIEFALHSPPTFSLSQALTSASICLFLQQKKNNTQTSRTNITHFTIVALVLSMFVLKHSHLTEKPTPLPLGLFLWNFPPPKVAMGEKVPPEGILCLYDFLFHSFHSLPNCFYFFQTHRNDNENTVDINLPPSTR